METINWLTDFYATIEEDPRITVIHICVYIAIRYYWEENDCMDHIEIDRGNIMQLAKISSPVTYHKCMHALHDFGYIQYSPFCGRRKSLVKLRRL